MLESCDSARAPRAESAVTRCARDSRSASCFFRLSLSSSRACSRSLACFGLCFALPFFGVVVDLQGRTVSHQRHFLSWLPYSGPRGASSTCFRLFRKLCVLALRPLELHALCRRPAVGAVRQAQCPNVSYRPADAQLPLAVRPDRQPVDRVSFSVSARRLSNPGTFCLKSSRSIVRFIT